MVVDEELKMMSRLCEGGGKVSALKLKQLSRCGSYGVCSKWSK